MAFFTGVNTSLVVNFVGVPLRAVDVVPVSGSSTSMSSGKKASTTGSERGEDGKGTCGKRKDQIVATKSSGLNEGVWDVGWVFTRGFLAERKFCVPQKSSPGER